MGALSHAPVAGFTITLECCRGRTQEPSSLPAPASAWALALGPWLGLEGGRQGDKGFMCFSSWHFAVQ